MCEPLSTTDNQNNNLYTTSLFFKEFFFFEDTNVRLLSRLYAVATDSGLQTPECV